MPVIIALEKLHKIPVTPWTGPFLTQGNLPLLKSLRVVSEARRAMRLHEHGVFARFRKLRPSGLDCRNSRIPVGATL
jgi:hypothetical protein